MSAFTQSRLAAALAGVAALSLVATPASAHGWRRYHDRGVDAGDVLAGVLILGTIAAVASAAGQANKDKQARDYRYPGDRYPDDGGYREEESRYGDPRGGDDAQGPGWRSGGSMDGAVDTCAQELERGDRRIGRVDGVGRDGDGWRVDGSLRDGRAFSCTVEDGRVRRATIDGRGVI